MEPAPRHLGSTASTSSSPAEGPPRRLLISRKKATRHYDNQAVKGECPACLPQKNNQAHTQYYHNALALDGVWQCGRVRKILAPPNSYRHPRMMYQIGLAIPNVMTYCIFNLVKRLYSRPSRHYIWRFKTSYYRDKVFFNKSNYINTFWMHKTGVEC